MAAVLEAGQNEEIYVASGGEVVGRVLLCAVRISRASTRCHLECEVRRSAGSAQADCRYSANARGQVISVVWIAEHVGR